jgi:hypothetical protein
MHLKRSDKAGRGLDVEGKAELLCLGTDTEFELARKSTFQPFPVGFPVISSHFQPIDRLENWLGTFSSRIFSGQFWRGLPLKFGRMTYWKVF